MPGREEALRLSDSYKSAEANREIIKELQPSLEFVMFPQLTQIVIHSCFHSKGTVLRSPSK
jgi:hypothetical protein